MPGAVAGTVQLRSRQSRSARRQERGPIGESDLAREPPQYVGEVRKRIDTGEPVHVYSFSRHANSHRSWAHVE
jgi:hypothetical protein